jgi:energy-coupling factor transport system ATP-binding protein
MLDSDGRIAMCGGIADIKDHRENYLPWRLAGLRREARSLATREVVLEAESIWHRYGGAEPALRDVSLALRRAETVAVMGPNGAGKTTLLERIGGLLKPSRSDGKGRALIGGRDAGRMPATDLYSHIMLLPQNPEHFFLRESVAEELELCPGEIGEAVRLFALEGLQARSPYQLSEGEKRRLNLACAYLEDRPVLLMDEPTYGLDYGAFEALVLAVRRLQERGVAILIVTHSPELAHLVADRIVFLEGGSVRSFLEPESVGRRADVQPVWERVAQ